MTTTQVTKQQLQILKHSIGDKPKSEATRNYFAISEGCDNFADCQKLAEIGLMKRGRQIPSGMIYFHVTDEGFDFLGYYR